MNKLLYAAKIDALLPAAEFFADRDLIEHLKNGGKEIEQRPALKGKHVVSSVGHQVPVADNSDYQYRSHCMWSEFFHDNMNRLAREQGLRNL